MHPTFIRAPTLARSETLLIVHFFIFVQRGNVFPPHNNCRHSYPPRPAGRQAGGGLTPLYLSGSSRSPSALRVPTGVSCQENDRGSQSLVPLPPTYHLPLRFPPQTTRSGGKGRSSWPRASARTPPSTPCSSTVRRAPFRMPHRTSSEDGTERYVVRLSTLGGVGPFIRQCLGALAQRGEHKCRRLFRCPACFAD